MIGMATTRDENLRSVNLLTVFPQGKTLSTWQPAASDKIDITKWVYDSVTGLLTDKVYADGQGPSYAYTSEGKLSRRTWARGIITDYAYDFVGALTNVVYNDETPDFAYTYNRLGQQLSATSSVSTNLFVYSPVTLELDYELQNGTKIDRSTDGLGRNTGYALYNPVDPVNPVQEITYGFDSYGRFFFVNSGSSVVTNEFDYSYLPGSDLLAGYTASTPSTGSTILTASRSYELNRNLITAITNSVGSVPSVVSSFDYTNDTLGRRTARSDYYINRGSTETNTFGYNTFSEVTNAHMGTNTYSYAYDPIGNRDQCTIDNGQLIITNVYTANGLNQYTNITGGIATVPDHDLDGNLLSFNGWQYVWNGENRLVLASNNTAFVTYTYDHQGRMVTKTINDIVHRYLWDNFNIISKTIHHSSFTIHNSFVWGLDLSESLQGAGGVGGLLSVVKNQADLSAKAYYAAADANGNVTEYISANGTVEAHREYSAFGETLVSTGAMKDDFTHWWSTKPFDPVTGFSEYEYRKYLPPIGRWLSRDSIGIRGGLNEVGFVNNDGMNLWDLLGLENTEPKEEIECPCKQEDIDEIGRTMSAKAYALTKKTELVKKQIDPVTKEIETWTFHPEFSGRICCKDGEPYGTDPHKGDVYWVISEIDGKGGWKASAGLYDDNAPRCKEGETEVGIYHSHPDGAGFSPSDKLNKCIYLQNSGSFFCWRYLNGETCYWDPPKKEWVCKQK
ncbi:MAG: hypothetical protein PHY48_16065 [Candidatus Cloacimonetes bacterium]|nr:hypothetical protein [Candidatus Cloacimonadota bacterium]